jgi:hypothetical protein
MIRQTWWPAIMAADELHNIAGPKTLTYQAVAHEHVLARGWAFTGTPMSRANLFDGVLQWLLRFVMSEDERLLYSIASTPRSLGDVDRELKTAIRRAVREKKSLKEAMEQDKKLSSFLGAFGRVFGPLYIARNEKPTDPWGRKLNLVKAKLESRYTCLTYGKDVHANLLAMEKQLTSLQRLRYEENMAT